MMFYKNDGLRTENINKAPRLTTLLIIFVIAIAMTACGDNSSGPGTGNGNGNGNEEPGPNEVWMVGQSFTPGELTVETGTTVTWINESQLVHTVTSGTPGEPDGLFDSGNVSPGGEFAYTFDEPGTYDYFCIPHQPSMTGTITVIEPE